MQTHVKRKINGRTLMVTVAKAKAMDRARKLAGNDRAAKAAVTSVRKTVTGKGMPFYQKQIMQLQSQVSFLEGRCQQYDRELTAALDRSVRLQETIKVMSGLLTELDAQSLTRRQLDDELPF
ncbi:hypothetical protein NKH37_28770 [Mesorhizobium sp. M1217]|uniref:hypothetical protein n=1 Tax=Mesorhizobium sp. M1217 TaxID=2957070 RepID=UPI003336EB8C